MLQVKKKPRLKAAKRLPKAVQQISNGVRLQPRIFSSYSLVLFFANLVVFKLSQGLLQEFRMTLRR